MGKKATFVIDQTILEEAKAIVETKRFKSLNRFVEEAIKDEIERIRKEEIEKAIREASRDPAFLSDIRDVEHDFEFADFEYEEK
jgi:predicted Holliday junction resolvase-like endonuclease